jgi:hypothetical protein
MSSIAFARQAPEAKQRFRQHPRLFRPICGGVLIARPGLPIASSAVPITGAAVPITGAAVPAAQEAFRLLTLAFQSVAQACRPLVHQFQEPDWGFRWAGRLL